MKKRSRLYLLASRIIIFLIILLAAITYKLVPVSAQIISPVPLEQAYGFGWINSLAEGTQLLINPAFALAATAVTVYFIIGGLRFLLSGGDKNAIDGARKMITHAIIGFVLLMLSFIVLQFIFQFFGLEEYRIIK